MAPKSLKEKGSRTTQAKAIRRVQDATPANQLEIAIGEQVRTFRKQLHMTVAEVAHQGDLSPGMLRVTRHPFLWGTALWAASHLLVNGDAASMVLMGGVLVLSLGGMRHIDQRREALGGNWGPVKLTTSALPFAALASGRTTMDWRGIGWWRPLLALVLYGALLHGHAWLIGVNALPA